MSARVASDQLLAELDPWIRRQRWFAGKARDVETIDVRDILVLDERVIDVYVRVS
jgi:hypothetical protein